MAALPNNWPYSTKNQVLVSVQSTVAAFFCCF